LQKRYAMSLLEDAFNDLHSQGVVRIGDIPLQRVLDLVKEKTGKLAGL
jgi:hypothetical protein